MALSPLSLLITEYIHICLRVLVHLISWYMSVCHRIASIAKSFFSFLHRLIERDERGYGVERGKCDKSGGGDDEQKEAQWESKRQHKSTRAQGNWEQEERGNSSSLSYETVSQLSGRKLFVTWFVNYETTKNLDSWRDVLRHKWNGSPSSSAYTSSRRCQQMNDGRVGRSMKYSVPHNR